MNEDERACLTAAIDPSVDEGARTRIIAWAEHITANAALLEGALAGELILTGFEAGDDEPTWESRPRMMLPAWLRDALERYQNSLGR